MKQPARFNSTTVVLYLVAGLLLANLVVSLSRPDSPSLLPAAMAQRQPPIAGGAGVFVMPAQLSANTYGCYLMDVDRGTLCVYQFLPGNKELQFVAARRYTNDTRLENFNTTPAPSQIANLVERQNNPDRVGNPDAGRP